MPCRQRVLVFVWGEVDTSASVENLKLPAKLTDEAYGARIFVNFIVPEDGGISSVRITGNRRHSA